MTRAAHSTDFSVDVEGVGRFVFGRRAMADQIKINVEYAKMTEAVTPTPWLDQIATWLSTLQVMTVRHPEGFDPFALDPFDDDTYANIMKVYLSLTEQEHSFRRKPTGSVEAGGQGAVANP